MGCVLGWNIDEAGLRTEGSCLSHQMRKSLHISAPGRFHPLESVTNEFPAILEHELPSLFSHCPSLNPILCQLESRKSVL